MALGAGVRMSPSWRWVRVPWAGTQPRGLFLHVAPTIAEVVIPVPGRRRASGMLDPPDPPVFPTPSIRAPCYALSYNRSLWRWVESTIFARLLRGGVLDSQAVDR